ncbi:hypothetical protein ACJJTC_004997 [Scirpophaga incertulas]
MGEMVNIRSNGEAKNQKEKKEDEDESGDAGLETDEVRLPATDESSSDTDEEVSNADKYKPYYVTDYIRRYPEEISGTEFVVFVESSDNQTPIGSRDLLSLSTCLKRFNKGVNF